MWENNLRVLIWQFYYTVTLCRRAASVLRTVWVQSDRFQFFFKREVSLGVNSHIWRGVSCFFFAFGRSSRLTLLVGEQHTCSISQTFLVSYEKWPPKSENPKNTVFLLQWCWRKTYSSISAIMFGKAGIYFLHYELF